MALTERARAYITTLPPAMAGQRGHAATFAAACRLVEFGLSPDQAFPLLLEWNQTHCKPLWTEGELRHKLTDAFRVTLPKEQFTQWGRQPNRTLGYWQKPSVATADTQTKRARTGFSGSFFEESPSESQFSSLASLRGLSTEGVRLAHDRGLLRFGQHQKRGAWFILDGSRRVAQARRLDGQPWTEDAKAWTLGGSQATWPVGVEEAALFPFIAFCEGGPDLLAAFHFIWAESRERDCAAVAVLGGANIHAAALELFAGKRIRIFRHLDDMGNAAMNRWAEQLTAAGADVDAFNFAGLSQSDAQPVKDLNDCAHIDADHFETHRCLWNLLP
jgi:hypothetical protein